MRIIVGIGGGIAAYKATALLRLFSKAGHEVVAMPTASALEFVGKATFEALSGNPVNTSVFEQVSDVNHVRQAEEADAIVVAPATADLLSRLAIGRADDLLSATILTTYAPVILAPAMHTQMWEHPATQANVKTLQGFGYHIIPPAYGRLTGKDSGIGRMPEPEEIFNSSLEILESTTSSERVENKPLPKTLSKKRIVITAGGTREPLDPVRFLGNRSSGKQGIALALEAQNRGAEVTLIHAHVNVLIPDSFETIAVSTAQQMRSAVLEQATQADALIMAAAVADFRPANYQEYKIKKDPRTNDAPVIELERNPDILREVVQLRKEDPERSARIIVGFAAETGSKDQSVLELGRAKLSRKECDFLAVNEVGESVGFGAESNTVALLNRFNQNVVTISGSKDEVAQGILSNIEKYLNEG